MELDIKTITSDVELCETVQFGADPENNLELTGMCGIALVTGCALLSA